MKARQIALPVEPPHHGTALTFDVLEFESLTVALSDAAAGAFMRLVVWSWQHGPLPIARPGRASIARSRAFDGTWHELAPLFQKRRAGYVSPWLERIRATVRRHRQHAIAAGRASGRARRNGGKAPAARGVPVVRGNRFSRPPADFNVLAAFCSKELFDRYDALELEHRPTIHDLKETAGKLFDWSDDLDLPNRVFNATEAAWERKHSIARARIERRSAR